ncbi:MAG: type IV secretory system conjugative DNA transfer family protein [Oscillospiraceae bacterium]|nr:type IV secretory system conjugative DNA transfer family protein [Oscillospiraceae bacterium]
MAKNNGMPQKKGMTSFIIYIVIAVILLIIGMWSGYVLQETSGKNGKINFQKALDKTEDYINLESFILAAKSALKEKGTARKGTMYGGMAGLLIFAYQISKTPKRFHRKGEEHGSARWGTDKEKQSVGDINDFYNNVILASDVFLVLDRKKRDTNAMSDKERRVKESSDRKKEKNEKKRIDKLISKAKENSPMGISKKTEIFETDKHTLIRYNGSDKKVIVPDNINKIGEFAFALSEVKSVTMPSVTTVEQGAFFGCEKLEYIKMEKAETVGVSAFERCYALSDVYVGDKFRKADTTSFKQCLIVVIHSSVGGYVEQYANQNDITFDINGDYADNEVISIRKIVEKAKKVKKIQAMLNLNMLILGGSGTGKSRFFVKPNLLQCNTSFVVTDPSGELIQSCGKMLERMGYEIKVFNVDNMEYSCNYNPFHYINDTDGNYDETAVIKMINTFMINTKGEGQGGDPFWEDCIRLLLSSICFLLVETATEEQQNFSVVLDLIHKAKVIEGKEEEKSELDLMFDERRKASPNSLSIQYYDEFKQAAGKTMQSILISTTTRLQCFKLSKIRNLTCTDNIELDTLGDKKTALFIIIPSTDSTYNFLAAMMYSQLFDSLYRAAISKYHGRLPCHVRFILDEFANTGKIPEFEKILATCRKFEISAQVILQNLSQLKRLYEKSWEEIPGNCDTTIFLGGKDQTNNEYIMKELGKETIDTMNVNKTKSKQGSTSYNDGILGRELMQLDELATMPNNECLVLIRGMRPFRTDKFDIANHPRYNMLDETNKAKNTYYLSENMHTKAEDEILDFSNYDTGETVGTDNRGTVTVSYVSSDKNVIVPLSELNKNIKPEINAIFEEVGEIYSSEIA